MVLWMFNLYSLLHHLYLAQSSSVLNLYPAYISTFCSDSSQTRLHNWVALTLTYEFCLWQLCVLLVENVFGLENYIMIAVILIIVLKSCLLGRDYSFLASELKMNFTFRKYLR